MNTTYRNLRIGAPKRLAYLRDYVESHNAKVNAGKGGRLIDWRSARFGNFLSNDSGLSAGYNTEYGRNIDIYSTFDDDALPGRVCYLDETENPRSGRNYASHKGWFTDEDGTEVARPFFVRLTHGRYLAGYTTSDNDGHVVFTTVYDSDRAAAADADSHACVYAEDEREYDAKWQAARRLESDIEETEQRVRDLWIVRNAPGIWREETRNHIEKLRAQRKRLNDEFKDVL
ncbi:hypothetical protein H1O16_gp042 [Burkholderia phage BcepSaruman]|uniref:Uncharacterized protein n=1 Tax=Burkholderia phage BcepSaruman TaxID=2530032 RepID=A0A4D5ZBT9_9CAUD|nr:hypothetical protein H1O16_gp042 [Burkholderia phage BcepSaruman]QBX06455.1 hypothetical protein BcepSaruman_042 [Burkholderia phage BcepSaruman]